MTVGITALRVQVLVIIGRLGETSGVTPTLIAESVGHAHHPTLNAIKDLHKGRFISVKKGNLRLTKKGQGVFQAVFPIPEQTPRYCTTTHSQRSLGAILRGDP